MSATFPDLPLRLRYAISAVCALARAQAPVSSRALAEQTGLPQPFLAKVLVDLHEAALLDATRGRRGGYSLARPADQITLAAIRDAVQEQPDHARICAMRNQPCSDGDPCAMHTLWTMATGPVRQLFAEVTIAELARG